MSRKGNRKRRFLRGLIRKAVPFEGCFHPQAYPMRTAARGRRAIACPDCSLILVVSQGDELGKLGFTVADFDREVHWNRV